MLALRLASFNLILTSVGKPVDDAVNLKVKSVFTAVGCELSNYSTLEFCGSANFLSIKTVKSDGPRHMHMHAEHWERINTI